MAGYKKKDFRRNTPLAGLQKVAEIYEWIERQIYAKNNLVGQCNACGRCCDFDAYDHRLYVSTPEIIYLAASLGVENLKPMTTGKCPYNIDGRCGVYQYRFAGCRIFSCKADVDFQSRLTEAALKKLKSLCTEYEIPYLYTDLASALNSPIVF
ncbi:MAG: YkgJ family cysteine cluster protein [Sedimentisphaerales bacterium]|nr:YkgJ family cysteine cluster protein [Sedimentisphaerales bacterium]